MIRNRHEPPLEFRCGGCGRSGGVRAASARWRCRASGRIGSGATTPAGPDGSRFVDLNQITKDNVNRLEVAWSYPHGLNTFNPIYVAWCHLRARPHERPRRARRHDRQGNLGARPVGRHGAPRHQLLGEPRRTRSPSDLHDQRLPAGDRRAHRQDHPHVRHERRGRSARRPRPRSGHDWPRPVRHARQGLAEPASCWARPPAKPTSRRRAICVRYDIVTGKLAWQFHTVPHPGEFGYETWPKDAYKYIGGTNTWGELTVDDERGIAYFPTGSATFDYYGGDRPGANLFANCLDRARRTHRQAPVALPERAPRPLGPGQHLGADADDDPPERPIDRRGRAGGQDRLPLRVQSRDGRTDLADRGAVRCRRRRASPANRSGPRSRSRRTRRRSAARRSPSRTSTRISSRLSNARSTQQRVTKARNDGVFTPIGFDEVVHMPGNHGGSNFGSTSSNPRDGSVYVINFNVPALMRLLKPGEKPTPGRRGFVRSGTRGVPGELRVVPRTDAAGQRERPAARRCELSTRGRGDSRHHHERTRTNAGVPSVERGRHRLAARPDGDSPIPTWVVAVAVAVAHRQRISRRACSWSQDLPPIGPRRLPAPAPVRWWRAHGVRLVS